MEKVIAETKHPEIKRVSSGWKQAMLNTMKDIAPHMMFGRWQDPSPVEMLWESQSSPINDKPMFPLQKELVV